MIGVQTGSGAHPAFYPMGTRGAFPGDKAAGAWSWPFTSIKCWGQRMSGAIPSLPNTSSWRGAWLKHKNTFTCPYILHILPPPPSRKFCFDCRQPIVMRRHTLGAWMWVTTTEDRKAIRHNASYWQTFPSLPVLRTEIYASTAHYHNRLSRHHLHISKINLP
jgi:hypothetical protein